ncbi:MAG: histidine phosphatase family protein [Hyphomicrobiales bacterium]
MTAHPIYFLRHGETAWNRERRLQGQRDTELNELGHNQARAIAACLADTLPDISGFYFHVSPLQRARQTMAYVQETLGISDDALKIDERLAEKSFGVYDGRTWGELNSEGIDPEFAPEAYYEWQPEGGESYAGATKRVAEWLSELSAPAVVVSHGGISRILRGIVLSLPGHEIVRLKVPQNRFFRLADGSIEWFDAAPYAAGKI